MPRPKQPPEYFEARRAINRHLHRHHGTTGTGMLSDRLDIHEQLHIVAKRLGHDTGHVHEPCADGEDDVALAWRVLKEGTAFHGEEEKGPDIRVDMSAEAQERRERRRRSGKANSSEDS